MKAIKEHGECIIHTANNSYFFRPSFQAMDSLGSPEEIVRIFAAVHDDSTVKLVTDLTMLCGKVPEWTVDYISRYGQVKTSLMAAMDVLTACCDEDITPLIGEMKLSKRAGRTWLWHRGQMDHSDIVIIASNLLQHGIIGKAKVRIPLRAEQGNKRTTSFRAVDYINSARTHFNLSREEAASLTMTEFSLMLNAKYPPPEGLTRDEFEDSKAEAIRLRKARIEAEKIKKEANNG